MSRRKTPPRSAALPPAPKVTLPPYKKRKIPKALREAVWIKHAGPDTMSMKCKTPWCPNTITAFNFQTGHNVPESKGGATTIDNLVPICSRCNMSMGNQYTFDEWSTNFDAPRRTWFQWFLSLFCCCGLRKRETTVEPVPSGKASKKTSR